MDGITRNDARFMLQNGRTLGRTRCGSTAVVKQNYRGFRGGWNVGQQVTNDNAIGFWLEDPTSSYRAAILARGRLILILKGIKGKREQRVFN